MQDNILTGRSVTVYLYSYIAIGSAEKKNEFGEWFFIPELIVPYKHRMSEKGKSEAIENFALQNLNSGKIKERLSRWKIIDTLSSRRKYLIKHNFPFGGVFEWDKYEYKNPTRIKDYLRCYPSSFSNDDGFIDVNICHCRYRCITYVPSMSDIQWIHDNK